MIGKVLSTDEAHSLDRPYTPKDIVKSLKEIKGRKAPEPDGLQTCFLHKHWNVLGPKVISVALESLNNGKDISAINDTNIALIPKIKSPTLVKNYRLIGLCNIIYKLISKVIVNILKPLCLLLFMITKTLL